MPSIIGVRRALLTPRPAVVASGGIGTLPTVAATLAMRLRFDSGVTMNGSNVASVVDMISGITFAQATSGEQPPLTLAAYNGKPCLALSDGKWLATSGNVPGINASNFATVVVIGKLRSTAGSSTDRFVLSSHDSTAKTGYGFCGNDHNGRQSLIYGDGTNITYLNSGTGANLSLLINSLASNSSGGTKEIAYISGSNVDSTASAIVANATKPTYIGTDANNVGGTNTGAPFDLCEILWYNGGTSSSEQTGLHGYAQTEWGVV